MPFASWRSWCRWVVDLCFLALESRKRPEVMGDDYPGFFSLVRTPTKWGPLDFLEVLFSTIFIYNTYSYYVCSGRLDSDIEWYNTLIFWYILHVLNHCWLIRYGYICCISSFKECTSLTYRSKYYLHQFGYATRVHLDQYDIEQLARICLLLWRWLQRCCVAGFDDVGSLLSSVFTCHLLFFSEFCGTKRCQSLILSQGTDCFFHKQLRYLK